MGKQVTALLGVGADPNVSARVLEHDDIAPLAIAVARNDENIARALLDAGAVKHWMDPHGRSPLMYAARCASVSRLECGAAVPGVNADCACILC
jgi:ankyrin repeat protein